MKRNHVIMVIAATLVPLLSVLFSCDRLGQDLQSRSAKLSVSFIKGGELFTKAGLNVPDTSAFLLKITDQSGKVIYNGKYGDCPESLDVSPGSYNVRVVSSEFTKPAFDAPQFGDEQCVLDGQHERTAALHLTCEKVRVQLGREACPVAEDLAFREREDCDEHDRGVEHYQQQPYVALCKKSLHDLYPPFVNFLLVILQQACDTDDHEHHQ